MLIAAGAATVAVALGFGLNRLVVGGSRGSIEVGRDQAFPAVSVTSSTPENPSTASPDDCNRWPSMRCRAGNT